VTVSPRICSIGDESSTTLEGQIEAHLSAGLTGIELRTIASRGIDELTNAEMLRVALALDRAGLEVPVIDTPIGGWSVDLATSMDDELERLRLFARRGADVGCRHFRVMSYPCDERSEAQWRRESLRRIVLLTDAAAALDIVLLHENCHGWAARSPEATIEMLEQAQSPHLRLLFDIGNGLAYSYEAFAFLQGILPWVEHVHVTDGVGRVEPRYVLPGAGEARVAACCAMLLASGYEGWFSLEPHIALVPHEGVESSETNKRERHGSAVASFRRLLGELGEAEIVR
jgi:sugar phosphate isomerase/epimerase